jgi:hypothetical protein
MLHRGKDGPDAGVGNDQIGTPNLVVKCGRREEVRVANPVRPPLCIANLGENIIATVLGSPIVYRADEAVERRMSANGHEYHSTAPAYSGPLGRARCSHWVSHRSAMAPAF